MRVALALIAVKVAVHLAVLSRYGWHGDELYFVECGRHLALGYVDHPPLVPWIAAAMDALAGPALWALRLPAVAAGAGAMLFVALTVREWGGGRLAQLLAGLSMLFAPAFLRMGAMLNIPVIEVLLCSAAAYLVARILVRGERRLWLLVGVVLGLGLLTKHSVLLFGLGLGVGLVATEHRRELATPWPWAGLALAAVIFAPNVAWQTSHGWATLEFLRNMSEGVLAQVGPALFGAGQLLYFGVLAVPVWVAGLIGAFTERRRAARPFAWLYLTAICVLLVTHGKPYYLAPAYPALFAAGGVALERWLAGRARLGRSYVAVHVVVGFAFGMLALPLLPLSTVDDAVGATFGWVVEPQMLTHDMHGMHGWHEHAATVDRVVEGLSPDEREQASLLVGSYSQASALEILRAEPEPRALSGHMNYFLWGPPLPAGELLITYGVSMELVGPHYASCEPVDRIEAPLARPFDTDLVVHVCRGARDPLSAWWPELRAFHHHAPRANVDGS